MSVRFAENIDREWSVEPDASRLLSAIELQEGDPLECLRIFQELAERGSNLAKCYLGDAYANGRGVDRDIEGGMQWYKEASDSGSIEASHRLAFWLWHFHKYQDAVAILEETSRRGYTPSMFLLGSIYYSDYDNHEIEKNAELAKNYWMLAETGGHLIAKRRLSILLRQKGSGLLNIVNGHGKLIRFLPEFLYYTIKFPKSDRLRGWNYGAGLGILKQ